jgi:hypothetical protein
MNSHRNLYFGAVVCMTAQEHEEGDSSLWDFRCPDAAQATVCYGVLIG